MKRRAIYATAVIVLILSFPTSRIHACEWAIGYFYKVTSLRGTVVGSKFPVLSSFRWFRHAVVRSQATLTLYDYCWPCNLRNLVPVKTAFAGNDGTFDFGNLKPGHYHLKIEDEKDSFSGLFEVEIIGRPNSRESEIIDISPAYPDCTGGHEFVVRVN